MHKKISDNTVDLCSLAFRIKNKIQKLIIAPGTGIKPGKFGINIEKDFKKLFFNLTNEQTRT